MTLLSTYSQPAVESGPVASVVFYVLMVILALGFAVKLLVGVCKVIVWVLDKIHGPPPPAPRPPQEFPAQDMEEYRRRIRDGGIKLD